MEVSELNCHHHHPVRGLEIASPSWILDAAAGESGAVTTKGGVLRVTVSCEPLTEKKLHPRPYCAALALLGFHRRRPRGGWCRHRRRPPELLSVSASGLCKLSEPIATRAAQNHHCVCRWDCERKKETLVLSQPFPGEKSVAPPCLAAGKCHCRRRKIMTVPTAA
ncbi:uncharacterized protein [Arachis hypogaea]|uniref:uncharacterized protein n=1 Tax=Arachis hypogaea TaxID=3818 RepID=UPI003B222714|nr:uncharacterized protein DS421_17g586580 [Arachis hypogaea]